MCNPCPGTYIHNGQYSTRLKEKQVHVHDVHKTITSYKNITYPKNVILPAQTFTITATKCYFYCTISSCLNDSLSNHPEIGTNL